MTVFINYVFQAMPGISKQSMVATVAANSIATNS